MTIGICAVSILQISCQNLDSFQLLLFDSCNVQCVYDMTTGLTTGLTCSHLLCVLWTKCQSLTSTKGYCLHGMVMSGFYLPGLGWLLRVQVLYAHVLHAQIHYTVCLDTTCIGTAYLGTVCLDATCMGTVTTVCMGATCLGIVCLGSRYYMLWVLPGTCLPCRLLQLISYA